MIRLLDLLASILGLLLFSPIILCCMLLIWLQDRNSPFYIPYRTGKDERPFRMVKLRSMVVNADSSGVDSTAADDMRITATGKFIRKCKLDEIMQLWNVLKGDMSLVGPRPNVKKETDLYNVHEKKLLTILPGITDFSSIVFSDEGEILRGANDPDQSYNDLIRPGKIALGLFYVTNRTLLLNVKLIVLTIVAIISKDMALKGVVSVLKKLNASQRLVDLASREYPLLQFSQELNDQIDDA